MREYELKELMESLTLIEKIGQLIQLSGDFYNTGQLAVGPQQKLGISQEIVDNAGSVLNVTGAKNVIRIQKEYLEKSRHKIPLLFMADIVYGYRTVFPIPLALGCSWNPEMVTELNKCTSKEAVAAGAHVTYAPMVDLVRDARWGRCMESTGEDVFLNSCFSKAMVKGFQDGLEEGRGIASCVKHFAAYGAVESGRDYNTVDMSERRLRQEYLPAYKAAVDAGCEMIMTSFNTIDQIPATANEWLMNDVLRKEWGFGGVIITDYAAIQELIAHGIAEDEKEASKLSLNATVDIDMKTGCYANQLEPLLSNGEISEKQIDNAVWRILKLKNKLGLFEDPYRMADIKKEEELFCCEEHRNAAREAVSKSIVLLKNYNNILPLSRDKKVSLIGPYGESKDLLGLWAVHANKEECINLKDAFSEVIGEENLIISKGCDILDDYSFLGEFGAMLSIPSEGLSKEEKDDLLMEAKKAAEKSDVVIMALGEHVMQSGEAGSRTDITLPEGQVKLLKEIKKCGKPIIVLLFNGRPLALSNILDYSDAIIECWFPGTEGAHGIVDVIYGKYNPSGRLSMSMPWDVGQVPVYYNHFNTGRPVGESAHTGRFVSKYLDCPNSPLYPFGYGLSYSDVEYYDLRLSNNFLNKDNQIEVSINVKNLGEILVEETVQLYIRDCFGSVVRPVKELKGFKKVILQPNEEKNITFVINEEMLRFYTKSMEFKSETGKFKVYIGKNSDDVIEGSFELIG